MGLADSGLAWLAKAAEDGGPLSKFDLAQQASALGTGFAAAAVDVQLLGEITGFTFSVGEVFECGTALLDRLSQDLLHLGNQHDKPLRHLSKLLICKQL